MTATTAVLDSVTFYGTDAGVADRLIFRTKKGDNDGPPVRTQSVPRPMKDGDFDLPITRGPRLIMLAGWCRASTEAALLTLRDQLMDVLADGSSGTYTLNEFAVTRTFTVRLFDTPTFDRQGLLRAEWSLKLRAANPLLTATGGDRW